jgi:hypothetical protein
VDDIVDIWVLAEDLLESSFVGDIGLVELWALPADELYAIDNLLRRIVQTVDNDDLVVGLQQSKRSEGADVASATISVSFIAGPI